MLREILDVLQDDSLSQRRWFHDDYFDLFLWQVGGELAAFELCYGIHTSDRAVVWSRGRDFFHDGGAANSGDPVDADPIVARFEMTSYGVPEVLRLALRDRLREFARRRAEIPVRRTRFRRAAWQQTASG